MKECVVEYGLKVNEKKSTVACINGEVGRRRWLMGDCCIGEVEEYEYLGITVEVGTHGGFRSMGDRMKQTNGNGEICSRAIREHICDWKGRMEDNDCYQSYVCMWSTGMVPTWMWRFRGDRKRIWQMAMGSRKGTRWASEMWIWMEFIRGKGDKMYCGLTA